MIIFTNKRLLRYSPKNKIGTSISEAVLKLYQQNRREKL